MDYILDTHTFLWFLDDSNELPKKVKKEIINSSNACYLSIASLWEIAIKVRIGKLKLNFPFEKLSDYLAELNIKVIEIDFLHLVELLKLEQHHRDPFDNLIIAQGLVENYIIISRDAMFSQYNVKVFW